MKQKEPRDERNDFTEVITVLRHAMKSKGMTYRDLAARLKLSESGLKKIFTGEDASFLRVSQIASALNLRLADVISEADQPRTKKMEFSAKQQEAFLETPALFRFFFRLVIERQTLAQMKTSDGLSEAAAFKFLKKLDELNLIQLLPEGKTRLPSLKLIRDFGGGPFLDKLYQDWAHALVSKLARPEHQANSNFIIRCVHMKDETYQEMLSRLRELDEEFLRRGIREMNLSPQGLKPIRWISMTDQKSFVEKII